MDDKQAFHKWWLDNGCRGISYCENHYNKISSRKIREYLKEFFETKERCKKSKDKQKIVQINDLHIPHHDKKTIEVFIKFLKDFKPDKLVIAGDLLDFYELSTFDKDPMRRFTIQDEIDQCYEVLKEFKEYCSEIHFIKGNHEDRLRRFLWKNPSLASIKVLELSKLLNLDTLGIEYHDFEYNFRHFRFTHGAIVRQESGASARAELLKYGGSMASGHTHRLGLYIKTDSRGTIAAYEGGCMCDLQPEYIQGVPNWQQGFLVFNFDKDRFFCQVVPILDHKFIFGQKKYQ
jgi:predicted phosphodiesterase